MGHFLLRKAILAKYEANFKEITSAERKARGVVTEECLGLITLPSGNRMELKLSPICQILGSKFLSRALWEFV